MAIRAKTGLVRVALSALAGVVVCLNAAPGDMEPVLSLERTAERRHGNFAPVLEGESATVRGTVSGKPMVFPMFSQLAIQDDSGHGLVLEGSVATFSQARPGAQVEARGTIAKRAGMPVLVIAQLRVLARGPVPEPRRVNLSELHSFRSLGVLFAVEGRVIDKGENASGDYLYIGDARKPLEVLLPRGAARPATLDHFEIGDRVRATGIGSQYCPFPPFNRSFRLVVASDDDIVLIRTRWLVSPEWLAVAIAFTVFALGLWWMRERRMAAQRNMVRIFYALAEEVIGVSSPAEIVSRLAATLPAVLGITGAHVYLFNRATKELDRVRQAADAKPFSVAVSAPEGALPLGPALAFRNQALLTIRDTRHSPFFPDGRTERLPGSLMFVPMFAESEILGVVELYDAKTDHEFTAEERILTQHLANQIGIALRLLEERSIREQLYRSEKLAAVGQLVSGIAAELRSPLESISTLAENLESAHLGYMGGDVRAIAGEAQKASDIVARLVSFMQPERAEPKRIELNALVRSLIEFRRQEWETRGFDIEEALAANPIYILGSQGQLERVFLDLLVQAEHALTDSPEKRLAIATGVLARRAVVEIDYAANVVKAPWENLGGAEAGSQGDGLARGVVRSHGGELRMSRSPEGACRLEVELPLAPERLSESGGIARAFTCLLVEPDHASREQLVRMLTQRGCRVIPASSGEDAAELVQRLRFDIVFCSVRLPGLNWIEFSESVRNQIGAFVLLTEGFDFELSRGLLSAESHLLSKPVVEPELDQVLSQVEARLASPEARLLLVRPDRKVSGDSY
ncbi:MAG TPA: GAF domain-containing protein [Bryobacteraceae bacterium]|nr:GAF domain-containing protein [Bryobacteraceae bacterium]